MTNPGSKLEIVDCDVLNGRLLLTPSSCKPLGGYVESIVEVWKNNEVFEELILTHQKQEVKKKSLQRSFLKIKVDNNDKPPMFISFDEFLKQKRNKQNKYKNELNFAENHDYDKLMSLSNTELLQEETKDAAVLTEEMIQKRNELLNNNEGQAQNLRWGKTLSSVCNEQKQLNGNRKK